MLSDSEGLKVSMWQEREEVNIYYPIGCYCK